MGEHDSNDNKYKACLVTKHKAAGGGREGVHRALIEGQQGI
jgi:hypothetical protein